MLSRLRQIRFQRQTLFKHAAFHATLLAFIEATRRSLKKRKQDNVEEMLAVPVWLWAIFHGANSAHLQVLFQRYADRVSWKDSDGKYQKHDTDLMTAALQDLYMVLKETGTLPEWIVPFIDDAVWWSQMPLDDLYREVFSRFLELDDKTFDKALNEFLHTTGGADVLKQQDSSSYMSIKDIAIRLLLDSKESAVSLAHSTKDETLDTHDAIVRTSMNIREGLFGEHTEQEKEDRRE